MARAVIVGQLERQPRTRYELAAALRRRLVPDDVAEAVLDHFTELGLIDDEQFADAWVDSRHRGRGLARRALSEELRRRGVDRDLVAEAVSAVSDDDERLAARTLVDRRLRSMTGVPDQVRRRRLAGMLGRKGFGGALAAEVIRAAVADSATDGSLGDDVD